MLILGLALCTQADEFFFFISQADELIDLHNISFQPPNEQQGVPLHFLPPPDNRFLKKKNLLQYALNSIIQPHESKEVDRVENH